MEIHFTALPENNRSLQMIQCVKTVPAIIPQAEQQQFKQKVYDILAHLQDKAATNFQTVMYKNYPLPITHVLSIYQ
jgi:hypothetical protein